MSSSWCLFLLMFLALSASMSTSHRPPASDDAIIGAESILSDDPQDRSLLEFASSTPACPCYRYVEFNSLPPSHLDAAESGLGYNSRTWNIVNPQQSNPLEDFYYDALNEDQQNAVENLGYDRDSYGCCINHFSWHHWGHMSNWYPWASEAYARLGWTKQSWNLDRDYPITSYKYWCRNVTSEEEDLCLTKREMQSLEEVCYTESSYRGYRLVGVPFDTYETPGECDIVRYGHNEDQDRNENGSEVEGVSALDLDGNEAIECPCVRYTPWSDLSLQSKSHAEKLGYDRWTWNYYDMVVNPVEYRSFSELDNKERRAAEGLGYDKDLWECCISHYRRYN